MVKIRNRTIDKNSPALIVAEVSCNHLQKYDLAVKTIKAIKDAGADAVKLQTYTPDTITIDSDNNWFKINQGTLWDGRTLYDLYKETYTPWHWQPKLKKIAEKIGLIFFSSPFDKTAADFLEDMDVPAYKIASFEISDIPLIEHVASKRKPVIISTGIAELHEIKEAIDACKKMGNEQVILLKCTSVYPAPHDEINLKAMSYLARRFKVVVGLSDHTLGLSVPIAAVALGAKIVEKHFILDRMLGGPDAAFSMEPKEFKGMVKAIREVEMAMGKPIYELSRKAKKNRAFRRSLFVVKDIKKSEIFTEENVKSIRPGYGMQPKFLKNVIGKKAKRDIRRGTPMNRELVI